MDEEKEEKRQLDKTNQKKKKKPTWLDETHVHLHMGISSYTKTLPSIFSPFLGENFLVNSSRKHWGSTISFPSLPLN